jgi:hypothetical protein
MRPLVGAFAALAVILPAAAQQQPPQKPVPMHPKVDQQKVDQAIQKGCQVIVGQGMGAFGHGQRNQPLAMQDHAELVLLTLLHSGYYFETSPELQPLLAYIKSKQIGSTYTASLMAMALQKADPRKYQERIAECAQFLADNQCENGQWDYGEPKPILPPEEKKDPTATTGGKRQDVATSGGAAGSSSGPGASSSSPAAPKSGKGVGKTEALPKVPIRKRKPGPPNGDNSNSQYAALGVRACLDAGCEIEKSVLDRARKWWTSAQNGDGGWGYNDRGNTGTDDNPDGVSNSSYGSMTVGAVGALCIYDYYLGMNYKGDSAVQRGLEWINKNYDVTKNPRKNAFAYLYSLYGLERVGMLYGTEIIGVHEWYPDGANHLLSIEKPGGGWNTNDKIDSGPRDTCFAILFLRRGTAPLRPVATGDQRFKPPLPGQAVANAANPQANAGGLQGMAKTVEGFAPGWKLVNNLQAPGTEKLVAARGKGGVLVTTPPNLNTAPTFRKEVAIPAGGKTTLRVVVGHPEGGEWTLVVRADATDLLAKVVGPSTAKDGWLEATVDLSKFGGKSVLLELLDQPSGKGTELAYWAEIVLRDQ